MSTVIIPVILPAGATNPTSFEYFYEAPNGTVISVNISESNTSEATAIDSKMKETFGWMIQDPEKRNFSFFAIPFAVFFATVILGVFMMFIAAVANMGGLITYQDVGTFGSWVARYGLLVAWPVFTLITIISEMVGRSQRSIKKLAQFAS